MSASPPEASPAAGKPIRRRDPLPDALRALALLGVLIVNAVNYPVAPAGPLLGATPQGWLDAVAVFVVATFVQAKAYPLLTFLFGMGLVWSARAHGRRVARQRFSQRQFRLAALGVLHGTLLYFGDILTMYAISAWTVWSTTQMRTGAAVARLRRAAIWALASAALLGSLAWLGSDDAAASMGRLAEARTPMIFLTTNTLAFVPSVLFGLVLVLPMIRLFMLAGIVAARLRLLTHRRWAQQSARWWRRLAWTALPANLAFGAAATLAMSASDGRQLWVDAVSMVVGPALSAWYVLGLVIARQQGRGAWAPTLAPLGQRTLSVYIAHALWCLVLFSGLGLGWSPGTGTVLSMSIVLWLVLVWAARQSPRRWPLEWWMGRRV